MNATSRRYLTWSIFPDVIILDPKTPYFGMLLKTHFKATTRGLPGISSPSPTMQFHCYQYLYFKNHYKPMSQWSPLHVSMRDKNHSCHFGAISYSIWKRVKYQHASRRTSSMGQLRFETIKATTGGQHLIWTLAFSPLVVALRRQKIYRFLADVILLKMHLQLNV